MKPDQFTGKRIRLTVMDPEKDAQHLARWNMDSEYQRLADSGPARQWSAASMKAYFEKGMEDWCAFNIYTLADNRLIGGISLDGFNWQTGDAWVGIGIGEKDCWGKGYGTEAMRLVVDYGFSELNLRRVSLNVFEYNQRAVTSYLKVGFKEEGRARQWLNRAGNRWDLIFMGILREEWTALPITAE